MFLNISFPCIGRKAFEIQLTAGSHSDSGVMNGRTNLWGKIAHEFTPEEGEAIRAVLRAQWEGEK